MSPRDQLIRRALRKARALDEALVPPNDPRRWSFATAEEKAALLADLRFGGNVGTLPDFAKRGEGDALTVYGLSITVIDPEKATR